MIQSRKVAPVAPLIDGDLGARAQAAVEAIGRRLLALRAGRHADATIAGGQAGLAVCHAYLDGALPGRGHARAATRALERAGNALAAAPFPPGLYSGFTGVAWAADHVAGRGGDRAEDDDPNVEIDAVLAEFLETSPWDDHYDLISGLVGFAVYALQRATRPSARRILELVVSRLDEAAERGPGTVTWWTDPRLLPRDQARSTPRGYHNLGVAHGVPGVIAILGGIHAAGIAQDRVRPLLDGAVRWLLEQRLPAGGGARFASTLEPGTKPVPTRTAWCYGDPGIAAALLVAARAVGEPTWEAEAIELALGAAARPPAECGVKDAGLCHGAAGLAHIFHRLYRATGEPRFAEAARFWLTRTLDMRRPGRGVAGFLALTPTVSGKLSYQAKPGVLTGAGGIALALIAALTPTPPSWDQILLLSLPGVESV